MTIKTAVKEKTVTENLSSRGKLKLTCEQDEKTHQNTKFVHETGIYTNTHSHLGSQQLSHSAMQLDCVSSTLLQHK